MTPGAWVLLPGASRLKAGGDRVGRLTEAPRGDGTVDVRWADVRWSEDGDGGSVERVEAATLAEAPGTMGGDDYASRSASWDALTQAQRDAWCVCYGSPPVPPPKPPLRTHACA